MKQAFRLTGVVVFFVFLAVLGASTVHADAPSELARNVVGLEKKLWKAWSEGDAAVFEKYLTDEFRNVGSWGVQTKTEFLESLERCEVEAYSLSEFDLVVVNKETVLLTYLAEQEAACDGVPLPERVLSTALYVLRKKHWRSALYTESALLD